jgi:uncharacterized protein (DUF1697 family)
LKYITLLRGINVSGQKKIKMDDLRALYKQLGHSHVASYIQSGNVLFDSNETDITVLKQKIEESISTQYRFQVPVIIRTKQDFDRIIYNYPFTGIEITGNETKLLVTFLSSKPSKEKVSLLSDYTTELEKLVAAGEQIYLYCPGGYGTSKLSNSFLEKKLGLTATTRNWRSLCKLQELADGDSV